MKFLIGLLFASVALAGPSSSTKLTGQFLKNGSNLFQIPNTGGPDQLVMRSSTDTLTNKTINASSNTISNLGSANLGGALTSGHIIVGNGSNVSADTGVTGDVSLSNAGVTAYSGVVPINKGGTNNASLAVTSGGVIAGDGSKLVNVGAGTAGQLLLGGTPPTWGNNTMTQQILTSTGTTTGFWFNYSSNITVGSNCIYTNNGNTLISLNSISSASQQWFKLTGGSGTLSGSTLTYSAGIGCNGSGNITCSGSNCATAATPLATYTTPSNARLLKVVITAGGGSGGGVTSTASDSAAGGGGGGGGTCVKYISSPNSTYYYSVGTGAAASSSTGTNGVLSSFFSDVGVGSIAMVAGGGDHGSAGAPTTLGFTGGAGQSTSTGCDLKIEGSSGGSGVVLNGTAQACGGAGGGTFWTGITNVGCDGNAAGIDGKTNTGQGSSGGVNVNNGGAKSSGNAAAGIAVIEEYY